eukprot:CAMPEP_0194207020 /NCGR_PEP_ID=MMETSP0156-20130528/5894_1 /TAXON_ID=33649 /ORGANISM="Thalassionema nitzschioides, Strain L26-B" /LENGTH=596 /DNA_ID=CAMNT_0038933691 /DNA_START=122 /DNA_END=1912 /DNA_ORIENTATION=-
MKVNIFLRAENLTSASGWRKKAPNTFAVVSLVTGVGSVLGIKRRRLCITEIVPHTVSPEWATIPVIDHRPRSEERVAIDIFQIKNENETITSKEYHEKGYHGNEHRGAPTDFKDAKHITGVVVSVDEVLQKPNATVIDTISGSSGGKVIVHMEVSKDPQDDSQLVFQMRGAYFPNLRKNFMEKSNFFFEILCKYHGQTEEQWNLVYRSDKEQSQNPIWETGVVDLATMCNQDLNRELLFRVIDLDGLHRRNELGCFQTNVHGLMAAVSNEGNCDTSKAFTLSKGNDERIGKIIVLLANVKTPGRSTDFSRSLDSPVIIAPVGPIEVLPLPMATVVDAISVVSIANADASYQAYKRNCSLDLCIAIDFTTGNGEFTSPSSAHYRTNDGKYNNYEWTMKVLGECFEGLSKTKEFPLWGFGGCFGEETYPIFQCGSSPKADGVSGLLTFYSESFTTGVKMGNPSCKMDNIFLAAAHYAKKQLDEAKRRNSLSYTLLTVLTVDGSSNLMAAKSKLVSVADAPLSILIVRIPTPKPSSAFPLDSEKIKAFLSGQNCRNFCSGMDGKHFIATRDSQKLSAKICEVLEEQMPKYFQSQGVAPL